METVKKLWENKMLRIFTIVIVSIIVIMIIIAIAAGNKSVNINEATLTNAAKKYLNSNTLLLPQNNYDSKNVSLSTLISEGYLDSKSEGSNCASYVTVTKVDNNYEYIPYIKCGKDTDTKILSDRILGDVVETGTGLYKTNDGYIYRGENPNNYVLLGPKDEGSKWRIIGLDESNNIKMIYRGVAADHDSWDDRYNAEFDDQIGLNNYINDGEASRIKAYFDLYFDSYKLVFTPSVKGRLAKFDACVGKVDMSSVEVNPCNEVLENVQIATINVMDYINASLDSNCSTSSTKDCQNYNFLNKNSWTITGNSASSSEVYYIDNEEGIQSGKAFTVRAYLPVIALKNNTIIVSGTGTEIDPYIVK